MTALAADLDEDGWTDIYVASDSTAAIHYRNNRDGTFTDVALQSGTAFSEQGNPQAGMGAALGDVNSDGRLDLLKTHFADDIPALYQALGRGLFEDVAVPAGLSVQNRHVEWGAGLPDLDNDGRADVMYVTGHVYPEVERVLPQYPHRGPRVVFRNLGGGRFADVTVESGGSARPRSSRGAAFGDVRQRRRRRRAGDEHERAAVAAAQRLPRLESLADGPADRCWSTSPAIGATVTVTAGGVTQARAVVSQSSYYSHDDLRLHFGLGAATTARSRRGPLARRHCRSRWRTSRADRVLTVSEPLPAAR